MLLGKSGSGKTASRENILRDWSSPNLPTETCKKHKANVDEKNIRIIDTPGRFEEEKLKSEMKKFVKLSSPGAHVFLLAIRLDERITDEDKIIVRCIQEKIGEDAAPYTIILFTHVDQLRGTTLDEYIREHSDLQALVDRCGGRYHAFNNRDRENQYQVSNLLEKIENMAERNNWKYYNNENFTQFITGKFSLERIRAAFGGAGIAGVIAGGVLLGVTELVAAPAVAVAGGIFAIGVAGVYSYEKFTKWRKKKAWESFANS